MTKKKVEVSEPFKKQILRFGKWMHKKAPNGVLDVTKDFVDKIVKNFKKSPFAPITRGHVKESELEKNPTLIVNKNISGLEADDKGLNAVMELEKEDLDKYNDVSVSLDLEGEDHESGKKIGPILRHVAMVTNPYIKGLGSWLPLKEAKSNLIINLSEMTDEKTKSEAEVKLEDKKEEETSETTEETAKEEEASEDEAKVETAELQAEKIAELEEKVAEQGLKIATKEAEAKFNILLKAGKITPAQKDSFVNLCTVSGSVVELSDGKTTDVKTLVENLFEKAPQIIEFKEKGVETETAEKDAKLKVELRASKKDMTDKEYEKWWEKNKETAKTFAGSKR